MTPLLMTGSPPEFISRCTANGWSDANCFLDWLHHFITNAKPTQDEQHIIILDSPHSHKTLAAIDFAKENGITLLTLPPLHSQIAATGCIIFQISKGCLQ